MEKRGFVLTIVLVLAAAMFASNINELTGQPIIPLQAPTVTTSDVCGNNIINQGESCDVGKTGNSFINCPYDGVTFGTACIGPEDYDATEKNKCQCVCSVGGEPCPQGFFCDPTVKWGSGWSGVCQPNPTTPTRGNLQQPSGQAPGGLKPFDEGDPEFLRSVYYVQPHALHHYFWRNLDLDRLEMDFKKIKATGFDAITIKNDPGDFVVNVNYTLGTFSKNQATLNDLATLVTIADSVGLKVILSDGPRIPDEAEGYGASCNSQGGFDGAGKVLPGGCGYLFPGWMVVDAFRNVHIGAIKIVVEEMKGYDNVVNFWHDSEYMNLNYWEYGSQIYLNSWQEFLQSDTLIGNPDLNYWNARWGQSYVNWSDVLFPVYTGGISKQRIVYNFMLNYPSAFQNYIDEADPINSPMNWNNSKFEDFRGWWDRIVLFPTLTNYTAAIKQGNSQQKVYYEVRLGQYPLFGGPGWLPYQQDEKTLRIGEWKLTQNLSYIEYFAYSGYAGGQALLDNSELIKDKLKEDDPGVTVKPFFMSEGGYGLPTLTLPEQQLQSDYVIDLMATLSQDNNANSFEGMSFWIFADTYFSGEVGEGSMGLVRADNDPKIAHQDVMDLFASQGQNVLGCAASNQLKDGSFEFSNNAWQISGNPVVIEDATAPLNVVGNKSMQLLAGDSISQTISVDNTIKNYELNVMLKADNPATNINILMTWKDKNSAIISTCPFNSIVTTTYTRYTKKCLTPTNANTLDISITTDNTLYVDDVDVVCES